MPPRLAKPEKEKVMSVGVLQFIPNSWHMLAFLYQKRAGESQPFASLSRSR
jgi:hypothetical protein